MRYSRSHTHTSFKSQSIGSSKPQCFAKHKFDTKYASDELDREKYMEFLHAEDIQSNISWMIRLRVCFFKVQWRNSWSIFKQIWYLKKEKSKLKLKNPRNEILFGIYVKIKYTINNLKRKTYSIQCWRRLRPPLRSCSFISLMELLKIISIFVIFLNSKRVGNIFSWWTSGTLIWNHFTGHFICSSIDWWLVILLASSEFTINSHTRHQTRLESSCHWI